MKRIALLILCLASSASTFATTAYVGDNLRVGVRNKPGTQTPPITVINSGEKLDVLENDGKYSRIKTSKGAEGWVRNTYLSKTPPAKLRLAELETHYKTAQTEVLVLQNQLIGFIQLYALSQEFIFEAEEMELARINQNAIKVE